jgi:hypothetical protein
MNAYYTIYDGKLTRVNEKGEKRTSSICGRRAANLLQIMKKLNIPIKKNAATN